MEHLGPEHFLQDLRQLPAAASVAIYGTGELGAYLHERLRRERPDVRIAAFFDSFRSGDFQGLPVLQMPRDAQQVPQVDLVIVATIFWADEVIETLGRAGPFPFLVSLLSPKAAPGPDFAEVERYASEVAEVRNFLATEADRDLWDVLTRAMQDGGTSRLAAWFVRNREQPYLHRVRLAPGDVIIEGGVFDGSNTAAFAELVGPTGRVYGFDPLGEQATASRSRAGQRLGDQVEIVPSALWSETTILHFVDAGAGSQVAAAPEAPGRPVPAVSIDDFAAARRLPRLDYVKLDVEGAEQQVLRGAENAIGEFRPQLAICIYHSLEDFFEIPLRLHDTLGDYRFHLFAYAPVIGDVVLYALPRERLGLP